MNPFLWRVGGAIWAFLVFIVTFYLAFPSDVMANRLAHEISERTRGEYQFSADGVSPWWVGVSASNVMLSSRAPAPGFGQEAGPSHLPFFLADEVSVRVGLFSLFSDTRQIVGQVLMGDALVDVNAALGLEEGKANLRKLEATADDVDVAEILALAGAGDSVDLSGAVDLDVDLDMRQGMDKAGGDISLTGSGVRILSVSYPAGTAPMEIDAPVDELDVRLRGDEGLFEVSRGSLASSLADLELEGEIRLGDRVSRSRIELTAEMELHDWTDTPLDAMRGLAEAGLARAKWSDDKYHYTVNTTVDRLDIGDFRPASESSSRRSSSSYTPPKRTVPSPVATPDPTRPTTPARPAVRPPEPMDEPEMLDDEEFEDEEFEDEEEELDEEEDIEMEGY